MNKTKPAGVRMKLDKLTSIYAKNWEERFMRQSEPMLNIMKKIVKGAKPISGQKWKEGSFNLNKAAGVTLGVIDPVGVATTSAASTPVEVSIDTNRYLNVCLCDHDQNGNSIPLKDLVGRLAAYVGNFGGEGNLQIAMFYKDKDGEFKPLLPSTPAGQTPKVKEELLSSLAVYKSKFSEVQFDRHWLEWIDQAFDKLVSSQQTETIQRIREWVKEHYSTFTPFDLETYLDSLEKGEK